MSWIIGIDLGTTNCTVACTEKQISNSPKIVQYSILQHESLTFKSEHLHLPSFVCFPLREEGDHPVVGIYAKERGEEIPDRVIGSAKSWLCHEGIDRRKAFLPLGDCDAKMSPIDASALFLSHIKEVWEKNNPNAPFKKQTILITVPASFDPSARQFVTEAAQAAGYPEITLIEEPLAAFYSWLHAKEKNWRQELHVGDLVLVIDMGGGTTDFSLMSVEDKDGELSLSRLAVGEHLLLGGDNLDLALAYFLKEKFSSPLDEWQFQSLVHTCRKAKEVLLGENSPSSIDVTIHGQGSSLIGGTLSTVLSKDDVERILIEGFFPLVNLTESILLEKKSGISQIGLPYVRDPRVTAHLAHFLRKSGNKLPSAVLFNGGSMKAPTFRKRVLETLARWKGEPLRELPDAELDFAVSRGACYYGWMRLGKGIRVRAGTSRSYFVGIEGAAPAVPGVSPPLKAVCLVPFGMEEGSEVILREEKFTLLLEEPALFRFFSLSQPVLSNGKKPEPGTTVKNWKEELNELHPIETVMHSKGTKEIENISFEEDKKCVEVSLKAKVTELGVLELWCAAEDNRQWKLEFNLRKD